MNIKIDRSLYNIIVDFAIASYLCDKPNKQLRKMAKKLRKKNGSSIFDLIVESSNPTQLVRVSYDQLTKRF